MTLLRDSEPAPAPTSGTTLAPTDRNLEAFRPIRLQKAADAVIAALAYAIRGGLYQPGEVLPRERDLAERLEVSRNVVREAIDVLRRAGVVSVKRGRSGGALVVAVDPLREIVIGLKGPVHDAMAEIAELRRVLEPPSFLLAATRASDSEVDALVVLVDALEPLLDDRDKFFATDLEFHAAVVRLSKNVQVIEHYEALLLRVRELRAQFPTAGVALRRALQNQRDLYLALRSRECKVISQAVDRHLVDFEEMILGEPLVLPFSIQCPD
jgi:GntR family transcriptional repressor for pyruvate dehydrogenase complex